MKFAPENVCPAQVIFYFNIIDNAGSWQIFFSAKSLKDQNKGENAMFRGKKRTDVNNIVIGH